MSRVLARAGETRREMQECSWRRLRVVYHEHPGSVDRINGRSFGYSRRGHVRGVPSQLPEGCAFAPRQGRAYKQLVAAFADPFALLDLATASGGRNPCDLNRRPTPTRLTMANGPCSRLCGRQDEANLAPISAVCSSMRTAVTKLLSGVSCAQAHMLHNVGVQCISPTAPPKNRRLRLDRDSGELGPQRLLANVGAYLKASMVEPRAFGNAGGRGYRVERWSEGEERKASGRGVPGAASPTCCRFWRGRSLNLCTSPLALMEYEDNLSRDATAGRLYAVSPSARPWKHLLRGEDPARK